MTTDNLRPPLEGITVINAGQILAAPHCATMLAEFGADVIKLERPGTGETIHGSIGYVQENRSQREASPATWPIPEARTCSGNSARRPTC